MEAAVTAMLRYPYHTVRLFRSTIDRHKRIVEHTPQDLETRCKWQRYQDNNNSQAWQVPPVSPVVTHICMMCLP